MSWKARSAVYAVLVVLVALPALWAEHYILQFRAWEGIAPREGRLPRSVPFPILFAHGMGANELSWVGVAGYLDAKRLRSGGVVRIGETGQPELGAARVPWEQADFFQIRISDPFARIPIWSGEIADAVAEVRRRTGASRVVLVGHSAGGLAARRYLVERLKDHGVAKLLTIATPHLGTPQANLALRQEDSWVLQQAKEWILTSFRVPPDAQILSDLVSEDQNPELEALNRAEHPQDVEYGCLRALGNPTPTFLKMGIRLIGEPSTIFSIDDGLVPAKSQHFQEVDFFRRHPTLVSFCPGLPAEHSEILKDYGEIAERIGTPWQFLRATRRPDPLSDGEMIEVEFHDFFAGVARIEAHDAANGAPVPASPPALYPGTTDFVGRVEIGPVDPARTAEVEMAIHSLGSKEPTFQRLDLRTLRRTP
jgi:pimeloyl-ACP methyl ester carboxylesterase